MEGTVYFFTGLSGAGKTTIGGLFYQRLHERKPDAVLLDGDVVRKMLTSGGPLPFSVEASQALQRAASEAKDYSYEGRLKGAWMLFRLYQGQLGNSLPAGSEGTVLVWHKKRGRCGHPRRRTGVPGCCDSKRRRRDAGTDRIAAGDTAGNAVQRKESQRENWI